MGSGKASLSSAKGLSKGEKGRCTPSALPARIKALLQIEVKPREERTAEDLIRYSRSANTLRTYASGIRDYIAWIGLSHPIPASVDHIVAYIVDRAKTLTPATLDQRIAALSFVHRGLEYEDPTAHPSVRAALSGNRKLAVKIDGYKPKRAQPLRLDVIRAVLTTVGTSMRDRRDRALLLVGVIGALRQSELAGLQLQHLGFYPDGVVIRLGAVKQDQAASHQFTSVLPRIGGAFCPVAALEDWVAVHEVGGLSGVSPTSPVSLPSVKKTGEPYAGDATPLFCPIHSSGRLTSRALSHTAMQTILRRLLAGSGMVGEAALGDYSIHSLRSTFVTIARELGLPDPHITKQTHHKHVAMLDVYDRPVDAFRGNAAVRVADALANNKQ